MANVLQLPIIPTEPFSVKVANGEPLKSQGRFENVSVLIQGIPFVLTLTWIGFGARCPLVGTIGYCIMQLETIDHGIQMGKSNSQVTRH